MDNKQATSRALAFYHSDGLVKALKLASRFAGSNGRVATIPDVIDARISTKPGAVTWERYFTTLSAEYVGYTRGKNRIIIVAHDVGPMARLAGILGAYRFHFDNKTKENRRGGRITYQEFHALESGKYGEVSIVDLDDYLRRYEFPFIEQLDVIQAYFDPLVHARLGKRWEEYLIKHLAFAREWHAEQMEIDEENRFNLPGHGQYLELRRKAHRNYAKVGSTPPILEISGANNCPYGTTPDEEARYGRKLVFPLEENGLPLAHLLSIGGLMDMRISGQYCGNLVCDIGCHEWSNGVRFVGIRGKEPITNIQEGSVVLDSKFKELWPKLLVPNTSRETPVLFELTKRGGQWFTENQETGDLQFVVKDIQKAGERKMFRNSIKGYHGIFRHTVEEVVAFAPEGANAYHFVDFYEKAKIEYENGEPEYHVTPIDFYHVTADLSQRMMTFREQEDNLDLSVELANS